MLDFRGVADSIFVCLFVGVFLYEDNNDVAVCDG